jgi:DNA repair protein RecN (Recombination protein N)
MLRSLYVKNFILIDSLDIQFPEGLIIITGATGAGKSILLGALSLLSGAKGDASKISPGADSCVVEAEFSREGGEELIVRRTLSRSGRSRCFINDEPVPQQQMEQVCAELFDIHSQHSSLLLTSSAYQLSVLDSFAGAEGERAACAQAFKEMRAAEAELSRLQREREEGLQRSDYDQARLAQLQEAALREGELEELEEEQKRLAHAEQIKQALSEASGLPDTRALREAERKLSHIHELLPETEALGERLASARIEIDDIVATLEQLEASVDVSESRLEAVENRISKIYSLFQRFGCRTVEELCAQQKELENRLEGSGHLDEQIAVLQDKVSQLRHDYEAAADRLSKLRAQAAPRFAERIAGDLRYLELERAVFEAQLSPAEPGATGRDALQLVFSAHGGTPAPLARCASGGELSRIMLCLKALMSEFRGMPTLIFDEIDTGVSGSVADKMGAMICTMGEHAQVMAITHLPQVAAKGEAHFIVSKELLPDGGAVSHIKKADPEARIQEIARLLSGASITPEAVANAKSLLGVH